MKKIINFLCVAILSFLVSVTSFAEEKDDARHASFQILSLLRTGQYSTLWDNDMSAFFKSKVTKSSFLANMAMGRAQLGNPLGNPEFIDETYSKYDPQSGFRGSIYSFTYKSSYKNGNFYERIVVLKEKDGVFRMAGIWGAPAGN